MAFDSDNAIFCVYNVVFLTAIYYFCTMKILTASQLKDVDAYTIEHEPISSIDLMERASCAVVERIKQRWGSTTPVTIFAGPGNNGGDALAVARLLSEADYTVVVYLFNTGDKLSDDCATNRKRLLDANSAKVTFVEVTNQFTPPQLTKNDLVIDGLFGTGLSRPLNGGFASVVKYINTSPATVVSIDIPSGLMCEDNSYNVMNHVIQASLTLTFQFPKLSFFFPEHEQMVGELEILDIGIADPHTEITESPYKVTELGDMMALLKTRSRFAHKGSVGHALLIAGKKGMAGAAILSSRACLRSGVGKLTVRTPEMNVPIMQMSVPEAVLSIDAGLECFSQSFDTLDYDAMAIGPGLGTEPVTTQAYIEQIAMTKCPAVIDADALNILGSHRGWINQLPRNSILTPHKKELFGLISNTRNSYEQLERTRELCKHQHIYIIIKGAFSAVVTPEGYVYFNPTGNPGMATAGSGDVLTGIILSLLAQGYSSENAARLGTYLHGLAGDIAAEELGYESLLSSDIVDCLPKAFKKLRNK